MPEIEELLQEQPRSVVVDAARAALDVARQGIAQGSESPSVAQLVVDVASRVQASEELSLRPVINATGVVIHTNLGRAPLSEEAARAMVEISQQYSNLEFDLASGERGSRHVHVEELLCRATGAEAAMAVNNNASALLLALMALAEGREAIVSRGQLVEIGGGFRIPDVMLQSGVQLVEVGTTNRTYAKDFEHAINPNTALLMRVHSSNFRLVGFTSEASIAELVDVGKLHGIDVLDDIGSGALLDTAAYGMLHEPMPQESIAAGAGVVCFSGDKLLGGPQAGLLVGKRAIIAQLKRHPLARAMRIDKSTLAGLQVTLNHYLRGEALQKIPIWRMIAMPLEELHRRAASWATELESLSATVEVIESRSAVGGGSLPGETLPTWVLAITIPTGALTLEAVALRLRQSSPAVVGRIEHDRLLFDPRTVLPGQDEALIGVVRAVLGGI
jgi:L-seryl-tRNA(Ser) seleniumtransferase